jgi:hypothetical protein
MNARINPLNPEGDDLLLEPNQHPIEGLLITLTVFRSQTHKARHCSEIRDKLLDGTMLASDEQVDAFWRQQDCPLEIAGFAEIQQVLALLLQTVQWREMVS